MSATPITAALTALLAAGAASAQSLTHGIAGDPAPAWRVDDWINLPKGRYDLEIEDLRGNVVVLQAFQAGCRGSRDRALPTLQRLIRHYQDADDVRFVAIQTVFENAERNTARAAWAMAREFDLTIPVGHDGGHAGPSPIVRDYNTGGTPWTVIIDPEGTVAINDFLISYPQAVEIIDGLRERVVTEVRPLPAERGGQHLVGQRFADPTFDRWIPGPPDGPPPKATLYRWWTDSCVFCQRSLPAVERLRRAYSDDGLRVVAVYHPKPPRAVTDAEIELAARYFSYKGLVAVDEDWSALDAAFPPDHPRPATSVSILVDGQGVIRFVHPGPVYFASARPEEAAENTDYRLLERAVRAVLAEASRQPPSRTGDPAPPETGEPKR